MTPTQKALVQQTFEQVVPIAQTAAALFYGRLFEMDAQLKPLFKTDLKVQGQKLMAMIATAVRGLDNLDALVPALKDLGKRHAAYGVKSADYGTVAGALLWTLEKGLGPAFTPEVKEAWTSCYQTLAATMQAGAAETAAA